MVFVVDEICNSHFAYIHMCVTSQYGLFSTERVVSVDMILGIQTDFSTYSIHHSPPR